MSINVQLDREQAILLVWMLRELLPVVAKAATRLIRVWRQTKKPW